MTLECTGRPRGGRAGLTGAVLMALAIAAGADAAGPPAAAAEAPLYRIFLRDGGMLVSYGEFARVADRIVLSMPIGGSADNPALHVLTIAEEDVDWERTNTYADALRARRYAETRGEQDFARLSHEVADMLNRIAFVEDPAVRLSLAERARRRLLEWPQQHHGYRAEDVAQMGVWLDQVVSELRVAAGQSSFDLAFVAGRPSGAPPVTLLPAPTLREQVEAGLTASRRAATASERVALLRAVIDALHPADGSAPPAEGEGSWKSAVHALASSELAAEVAVDRSYADLTARTLASAEGYVRKADVRGLQQLLQSVLQADRILQQARPAEMAALLATLDAHTREARRLRLARDAWTLRAGLIREYWESVRSGLDHLLSVRRWLEDVRELAGPSPRSVRRLSALAQQADRDLARVRAPAEVASAHAALRSAAGLASRAGAARLEALRTGDMDTAWQASSAAAGSLMMMDAAIQELRRITKAPRPW